MGQLYNPPGEPYCGYSLHENGSYTVSTESLNSLLKSEKILWALMQKGVHNFEHFEEAMKLAQQEDVE